MLASVPRAAISGVAFCPAAPVLVPAVAQGAAPELEALRVACRHAITRAAAGDRPVVLVQGGSAGTFAAGTRGSFAGVGVDLPVSLGPLGAGPDDVLSLPLAIGAWLVADALGTQHPCTAIVVDEALPEFAAASALVVLGDGSARGSRAAPGYLDDRAASFDEAVAAALAAGDPGALLAAASRAEVDELMVSGLPAWRAVGRSLAGTSWDGAVHYHDAPYGVGYLAASWSGKSR